MPKISVVLDIEVQDEEALKRLAEEKTQQAGWLTGELDEILEAEGRSAETLLEVILTMSPDSNAYVVEEASATALNTDD